MSGLDAIGGVGTLILAVARGLRHSLLGHPLWLQLAIGGVTRRVETGDKIHELQFTLQMVNEEPLRPIRVDGVILKIPALRVKSAIMQFDGRLGNRHWSQAWPIHLRDDKAILRINVPVDGIVVSPLAIKAIVSAPKGLRRKRVVSERLVIPGASLG